MTINTLADWQSLAVELTVHGYRIWQMQYYTDHPEGFHAWFCASGRPDVEVVTRDDAVYREIVKFRAR